MNRFDRNILIEGFGREGQDKLHQSKILVIGAGGLGSAVLYYLTAAGVGTLGIVDYDVVEVTNLQRQILHTSADVGKSKVLSAYEKLMALNREMFINMYKMKFSGENADKFLNEYDLIIDCSDNYATKFLINDVCVANNKPYIHGAVVSMKGEVMTYLPGNTCYRCIFGAEPEDGSLPGSAQAGILGSVAGVIGSIQATEAIKYVTGMGELLVNRLLVFDGRQMDFRILQAPKNQDCNCHS